MEAEIDTKCKCGGYKERAWLVCTNCYSTEKEARLSSSIQKQTVIKALGTLFQGRNPTNREIKDKFDLFLSFLESD